MYTIKDVAKKANVSTATVSRIVNNQPGYSEETKKKVLAVIEELNYQPNALARGLINKRTHTIGVLMPSFINTFGMELLYGVEETAHEEGLSIIVCHTDSFGAKTMNYLKVLNEKRVDGLVFISSSLEAEYVSYMKKMGIPVVLLGTETANVPFPAVQVDHRAVAYSAVTYLIGHGHQNIGMIAYEEEENLRVEGYETALRDHGLSVDSAHVVYTNGFSFEDGVHFFRKLLLQSPSLSAVYIMSDEIAVGAIAAAKELNLRVPEDVSIISHDNLRMAEMSIPKLTSASLPLRQMGQKAAELIFDMIQSGTTPPSITMPHEIIERDSVTKR